MGVLDDAIREHLDLKRRRGADPTEVERAEREALGPVRRVAEEPEEAGFGLDPAGEHPGSEPVAREAEPPLRSDEPNWHDPFAEESRAEPRGDLFAGDSLVEDHDDPFADDHDDPSVDDRVAPEPSPPAAAPPTVAFEPAAPVRAPTPEPEPAPVPAGSADRPPDQVGEETVEYDVERALETRPDDGSEDVLEETPEFLQDTPDHDRLWFEQKPPRDFDFDG